MIKPRDISDLYTIVIAAKHRKASTPADEYWNLKSFHGKSLLLAVIQSKVLNTNKLVVGLLETEEIAVNTSSIIQRSFPDAKIVTVPDGLPGALITSLFTLESIPSESPILITTGDSLQLHPMDEIAEQFLSSSCDAGVVCFDSQEPRFSYLRVNSSGRVAHVAEKRVIGQLATTGTYYFKSQQIFMEAAKWCLVNNIRTMDQFFVSSTLNYMIHRGMKIHSFKIASSSYVPLSTQNDIQEIGLGKEE